MRLNLDHVHIFASNIADTIAFFQTMFGAQVVWDEEAAGARNVRLAIGNAFIHVYDQPPKTPRGGAVHHIGIETDDLDALVSRMKANGFVFRKPIRDEPKFRYVMVSGPDELLIELFETREPRRWRVPA
jgi:catechol 2,3-dioxygenase-like lactoylglutathione lyase family enzyme